MNSRTAQLQQLFKHGSKLLQDGKADQALCLFHQAQEIDPSNSTIILYAGAALHELKRFDEAVACYEKAINITPLMGEAHNNLGNSLMALGRFSLAAESYSKAATILPLSPIPLAARATALQALGEVKDAETDCRQALKIDPSFPAAHWNLALNLLLQGDYQEGWKEYEWRWLKPDFTSPLRHKNTPIWDGSQLHGRTILLHAEQGFGDAIQFVRYVPLVARCGGNIILECHPQLVSLFNGVDGVKVVVPFGSPLPPFNCQAPLLSLPHIFGTTLQNVPSDCPYLTVSAECSKKWRSLMSAYKAHLRIGLVWAGKSYPDPLRSCRLAELSPLAADSNSSTTFFSLQVGAGVEEIDTSCCMKLIDLTSQIHDFADTAALVEQLDLVISIDTSVAHLAGALGKPVLLLLPYAPDWRWLLERSDSPWYPTMQIFRQKHSGGWSSVVNQVHSALLTLQKTKNPLR